MKRIVCEVCGGADMLKESGVFVCQSCGCKYSLEEVRKLLVEDGSAVQAGETAAPASQTGEYANMLTATRDAMVDGRFDSAYANSVRLIAMKPDVPELIAIQALAILGKGRMSLDIPAPTVRGMERFFALYEAWKADRAEQVATILNVRDYVCNACQAQDAMLREAITELNSRIQSDSLTDSLTDNLGALGDTIGMLVGDFYSTVHGLERESEQRQRDADNESIERQIEQIKERRRKLDDFRRRQIDRLAELLQSRQERFSGENGGNNSEIASAQDGIETEKYKIVSLDEIMCGKCGSVQSMRRKNGVCWKCGFRFSE